MRLRSFSSVKCPTTLCVTLVGLCACARPGGRRGAEEGGQIRARRECHRFASARKRARGGRRVRGSPRARAPSPRSCTPRESTPWRMRGTRRAGEIARPDPGVEGRRWSARARRWQSAAAPRRDFRTRSPLLDGSVWAADQPAPGRRGARRLPTTSKTGACIPRRVSPRHRTPPRRAPRRTLG